MALKRQPISEADYERIWDSRVLHRLRTDPRYLHAENAEDQTEAEDEISREVEASMKRDYVIVAD